MDRLFSIQFPTLLAQAELPPLEGMGIVAMFLWAIAAALFAGYVLVHLTELQYATLADGQQLRRRLPFSFRLLLPFAANVRVFRQPRYESLRQDTGRKLVSAGYDTVMSPEDFLAMRILNPAVLAPVFMLLLALLTSRIPAELGEGIRARQPLLFLGIFLYTLLQPRLWLEGTIRRRHKEIERGLPFVLDLLTLSVEAGLDFMTAIRRLVERRKVDALSEEFIRAIREMQVGRTRKDALKDMAARVNHADLNTVVNALVQAEDLGVGVGSVLRIQADQMRTRRFQRAEKLANEAPVKLLFPLVCFIFPCVFLVLLGPIFLEMAAKGF